MELALSTSEVEAALAATSSVAEAVPNVAVPELTVNVSVPTVELLPAKTLGLAINKLPVVTIWLTPFARVNEAVGLNKTVLPVPDPALGEKVPVVPARVKVLPETWMLLMPPVEPVY